MDIIWFMSTGAALGATGGLAAGPLTALVIAQTLRFGLREGLLVSWAPVLTDGPLLLAGAVLMTTLQDTSWAMGSISLVGAVFLLWLAKDCFNGARIDPNLPANEHPKSIKKALLTNALNPHPYLFWFVVGGPLVAEAWTQGLACVAAFLLAFFGLLVGSKMAIATLTHTFGGFMRGPLYKWVMWALGVAILVCAAYFAVEALTHFELI